MTPAQVAQAHAQLAVLARTQAWIDRLDRITAAADVIISVGGMGGAGFLTIDGATARMLALAAREQLARHHADARQILLSLGVELERLA